MQREIKYIRKTSPALRTRKKETPEKELKEKKIKIKQMKKIDIVYKEVGS